MYLDGIFIYIDDQERGHVEAMQWVLDILRKNGLFANLKKCWFYKDEMQFLGYVILSQGIRIEDEKSKAVRNWPEPKSVQDIQVFIGFANFNRQFIRGFSRITAPLTTILKTTRLSDLAPKLGANDNEVVGVVIRLMTRICQSPKSWKTQSLENKCISELRRNLHS